MVAHAKPKLIPVPHVPQRHGHDCGPACARAVLTALGQPHMQVDATLKPSRLNGTPPERLVWLFNRHGLQAAGWPQMSVDDLRDATEAGRPVLCPVQAGVLGGHWVVVRGVSHDRVYLTDPLHGLTDEPRADFEARWHDTAADGAHLPRFGIVVRPPAVSAA